MNPAYIIDAVRTPFGRYGGSLAGVRADDLAVIDITPQGLLVREMVEGLDLAELQNHTEAKLQDGR